MQTPAPPGGAAARLRENQRRHSPLGARLRTAQARLQSAATAGGPPPQVQLQALGQDPGHRRVPDGPEQGCPQRPGNEWVVTKYPRVTEHAEKGGRWGSWKCTLRRLLVRFAGGGGTHTAVALVQAAAAEPLLEAPLAGGRETRPTSNAQLPGSVPATSRTLAGLRTALHPSSRKFRETPGLSGVRTPHGTPADVLAPEPRRGTRGRHRPTDSGGRECGPALSPALCLLLRTRAFSFRSRDIRQKC